MRETSAPRPLGELVDLVNDKIVIGKDPDARYVGLEKLVSGSPDLAGWSPASASISANGVFREGDTLFGKLRPNLRKCVLAPFDGYCSTDILVLRAHDDVEPRFIGRVLQSATVFQTAVQTAVGTKMPRTAWHALRHLSVYAPSLPEQRQIAAILDTIDDAIRKTEQIIAKLKQVKQGLLHDLLTRGVDGNGELRDPERHPEQFKDSLLGRIPRGWEVAGLTTWGVQLVDGDRGVEYPRDSEFARDGYCVFLSAKNVTRRGFRFEEVAFVTQAKHRRLGNGALERGDIVVTTRGTLGNFAYFDDTVPFGVLRINSGMVIIRNADPNILTPFLYEVLRAPATGRQIALSAYGSAQPQLNLDILRRLLIVVPPLDEQQLLEARVSSLAKRKRYESAELDKLRLFKTGLMEDLLIGRVRVTKLLESAAE